MIVLYVSQQYRWQFDEALQASYLLRFGDFREVKLNHAAHERWQSRLEAGVQKHGVGTDAFSSYFDQLCSEHDEDVSVLGKPPVVSQGQLHAHYSFRELDSDYEGPVFLGRRLFFLSKENGVHSFIPLGPEERLSIRPAGKGHYRVVDRHDGESSSCYSLKECVLIVANAYKGKLLGSFLAGKSFMLGEPA